MKFAPFNQASVSDLSREFISEVKKEILNLDNEYVMKCSIAELEEFFVSKVTICALVLHTSNAFIQDRKNTPIEIRDDPRREVFRGERAVVPGTTIDIAIPYEGNPRLWHCTPSKHTLSPFPDIEVQNDRIVFSKSSPDDSAEQELSKPDIDATIASFADTVKNIRRDVEKHNEFAPKEVLKLVRQKRQTAESVLGVVSALGMPIRRREKPLSFTVPLRKKKFPVPRPPVQTEDYKPEPVLDEAEYQHILDVMKSMSLVMERSPKAFSTLDEEAIRNHFLLQLNGHYEGAATGETFNFSGKTDVLIRVQNRNVFVAECKFWNGPKGFNEAIDQLLTYLTWRDAKCALIVFNKNKDSGGVRAKMHKIMEKRPERTRTISHDPNGDSTYVLVKESEPVREIAITTQLYDVPTSSQQENPVSA
jgi:hypothetical protein